ncbi:hypothetical protein Vretimale_11879 [Volvox reticuliferus]|uniref:Peptidase S54 rhomboid domain-containing protein n=1 Tax=Volvox reticuliferus TaxID=1737510 RepID=A0A8J4GHE9_9CHLO|nr:hypothetical protein Vretifemale_11419 [Volvox reticuliferus]GIM07805.1 hypothetical protein Vretimale_11879 [Volvox reticuliferus]
MGVPLHLQVVIHPATSTITGVCLGVWLWLLQRKLSPAAVGLNYHSFVADRQWWRAIISQISHFELLHLVLNVSSLWALAAQAEPAGQWPVASLEYLRISVLLLLASAAVCLVLHHVAVVFLGQDRMRHTLMVGYSCVLFGWMTLIAWRSHGHGARFGLLGMVSVPMAVAPFLLLLVTQALLPNASFLGHLSGILAGLLLLFTGCLDWLTPYWMACLLFWVAIGICYGLALEGRIGTSYIRMLPYSTDINIEGRSEAARTADLMERGGAVLESARPASGTGYLREMAVATAAAVGGAATTLQTWLSALRPRLHGGPSRRLPPTTMSQSNANANIPHTAASAGIFPAITTRPALPWGNPSALPPSQ